MEAWKAHNVSRSFSANEGTAVMEPWRTTNAPLPFSANEGATGMEAWKAHNASPSFSTNEGAAGIKLAVLEQSSSCHHHQAEDKAGEAVVKTIVYSEKPSTCDPSPVGNPEHCTNTKNSMSSRIESNVTNPWIYIFFHCIANNTKPASNLSSPERSPTPIPSVTRSELSPAP